MTTWPDIERYRAVEESYKAALEELKRATAEYDAARARRPESPELAGQHRQLLELDGRVRSLYEELAQMRQDLATRTTYPGR